jgi:hypothetical protein
MLDEANQVEGKCERERLTAKTLNNDVFPAFCRPIIVISISVALYRNEEQRVSNHHHGAETPDSGPAVGRHTLAAGRQRTTTQGGEGNKAG